jgi:hypothetical protein
MDAGIGYNISKNVLYVVLCTPYSVLKDDPPELIVL